MARRKTDAERGPFGAWACNTRTVLDRSVEGVVAALPTIYNSATLRRVEGGSLPDQRPPVRMRRELGNLYERLAAASRVAIDAQPRLASGLEHRAEDTDGLAAAITALAAELAKARKEPDTIRQERLRFPAELLAALAPRPLEVAQP